MCEKRTGIRFHFKQGVRKDFYSGYRVKCQTKICVFTIPEYFIFFHCRDAATKKRPAMLVAGLCLPLKPQKNIVAIAHICQNLFR